MVLFWVLGVFPCAGPRSHNAVSKAECSARLSLRSHNAVLKVECPAGVQAWYSMGSGGIFGWIIMDSGGFFLHLRFFLV
jgi:hypothetical protein